MDRQILNITANEQILTVDEPIRISTNKVNYIEARFDLGQNWTGYDSIRAVWFNDFYCISTVLDSQGVCLVPSEVMKRNGKVKVNLVGSISENDVLTDRLTSYPIVAVIVDCTAQINGAETAPITPSQFEQYVAIVRGLVDSVKDIDHIELNPDYTLTIYYSDGTSDTTGSVRGADGNGIESVTKTGTSGLVDTYTITFTDGQTTTFNVTNGAKGDTGNGIQSIAKTSTVGLVDTYTITYTNGNTTTFTVTNGEKGEKGDPGEVSQAEFDEAVSDLKSDIGKHSDIITDNLMGIDVQQNLYPGAADWSGTWTASNPSSLSLANETLDGYPVMYYSAGWRKYSKSIPIEAGKTYTFEAWIKPVSTGAVFAYLKDGDTTSPATISSSMLQINGATANQWLKMSKTFTCSASGNITPYVYSGAGAFYFAKYVLVEGDTVFSLNDTLASKATQEQVSAVGDYQSYTYSIGTSLGRWMNHTFSKAVTKGDRVKLVFDSYSGASTLESLNLYGQKADTTFELFASIQNPTHGASVDAFALNNYSALRIQYIRDVDESNVTGVSLIATNHKLGITDDILLMRKSRVYHIEKDGSGDFSSFVDGINEACKYMDSVVYVGSGEYDLLDELGSAYIQNPSSDKKGLVLKNRVRVICSSQTVLKMNNTGTVLEYISPINTGEYGCTLENATIIDNKVRYSIHDDRGWSGSIPYTNKFINCTLIHKNGKYGDCIGGGLGENCDIEIRGCYLESDSNIQRLAYYHGNNHTGITNAKGRITVCDNYFAGVGSFWVQKYGDSTEMTTAYVSNNSFGSAPQVTADASAQDNMQMLAWNNEIRS